MMSLPTAPARGLTRQADLPLCQIQPSQLARGCSPACQPHMVHVDIRCGCMLGFGFRARWAGQGNVTFACGVLGANFRYSEPMSIMTSKIQARSLSASSQSVCCGWNAISKHSTCASAPSRTLASTAYRTLLYAPPVAPNTPDDRALDMAVAPR